MQRTLDLIKTASVPATVLRLAARGALAVPPMEMVEIMVYLATHSEDYGHQCTRTLMEWDEAASFKVAANPEVSEGSTRLLDQPTKSADRTSTCADRKSAYLRSCLAKSGASCVRNVFGCSP